MSENKRFTFGDALFSSTFIHNPVLIQAAGLCAVVAVATTLKTALLLAAAFLPVIVITQVFACLALKRVPRWIRVAIYLLIGTAIIASIIYLIDRFAPEISLGAGVYLALTAANSIVALHCEKLAVKTDLRHAFYDSIATALGYAAVIILVGLIREMVGSATIWGRPIKMIYTFPALLMPFGGFLVLAFLAAALRALINRRFPEHSAETEIEIKKNSVIVSKKNLPENLVYEEQTLADQAVNTEGEKTEIIEEEEEKAPEDAPQTEDIAEEPDDLTHFEHLEEPEDMSQSYLGEIFTLSEPTEHSENDEFGSALGRLFDDADSGSGKDDEEEGGDK